jgi:riboflavin biosynthesis pyrimidine reductase
LTSLELLWEADGLPAFALPAELSAIYPGTLGFDETRLYANFVATIDGVVAIPSLPQSNKLIAAGSAADRFVMGALRACADAVIVGSGTLAASPGGVWTPAQAYPDAAHAYADLRGELGLPHTLEVVILSASGDLDPAHPAVTGGALVLTTEAGAARLGDSANTVSLGIGAKVDPAAAVSALHARGHRRLLLEGGPHVIGSFLEAGAVDELFLTISPLIVGRPDTQLGLVEGADLVPGLNTRLLGVRRSDHHLFLRYGILPR